MRPSGGSSRNANIFDSKFVTVTVPATLRELSVCGRTNVTNIFIMFTNIFTNIFIMFTNVAGSENTLATAFQL